MPVRHIALCVFVALIWGAAFPLTAIALDDTPPIFFATVRFVMAAAFVVVVPRPAVRWRTLAALGVLLGAGQFGFMFVAMTKGISAGLASLLIHSQAFFTVAISMLVYREPVRRPQVLALLLALCGFAFLAADRAGADALTGVALILVAALSAAIGNNMFRRLGAVDMVGVSVWMSLFVPLPLFALSLLVEGAGSARGLILTLSWPSLAAALYSAVLATVFAFAVWGRMFAAYPAAKVAPFFLLVPIFGMTLSVVVLGEDVTRTQLLGSALVFAGLCLALWPRTGPGIPGRPVG